MPKYEFSTVIGDPNDYSLLVSKYAEAEAERERLEKSVNKTKLLIATLVVAAIGVGIAITMLAIFPPSAPIAALIGTGSVWMAVGYGTAAATGTFAAGAIIATGLATVSKTANVFTHALSSLAHGLNNWFNRLRGKETGIDLEANAEKLVESINEHNQAVRMEQYEVVQAKLDGYKQLGLSNEVRQIPTEEESLEVIEISKVTQNTGERSPGTKQVRSIFSQPKTRGFENIGEEERATYRQISANPA